MINTFVKTLSCVVLLAVAAVSANPAHAQEHREVFNQALEAARAQNLTEAYAGFTRAIRLAEQADDNEVANRARQIAAQIDYNAATQLMRQENFEGALARYEQGIALLPTYVRNYEGRAVALRRLDRGDEAIESLQALIAVGEQQGDTEAVRAGEQGIRDHYVFLASSALGRRSDPTMSDAREALQHLEALVEHVTPDSDVYFYMATAENVLGNHSAAIQYAEQALELHRGSRTDAAKIYFVKGEAHMYNGNREAAREAFQNSLFGSYRSLSEHYLETL